jgi:hypothetical protein
MKRFSFVLLAVSALAAVACTGTKTPPSGETGATGAPPARPAPGHVNVNVSCRDVGNGIGVRVQPWRVSPDAAQQVTWNLTPANDTMPTTLSAVNKSVWPFDNDSITWDSDSISVPLTKGVRADTYRYRLTIVCPTDTIVIDPEIIVN